MVDKLWSALASKSVKRLAISMSLVGLLWATYDGAAIPVQANASEGFALPLDGDEGETESKTARGLLRAAMRVELRSRLQAVVSEIPFREGQRFSHNDLLIGFDCRRFEAEARAANAGANVARIDAASKKRLLVHAAIGKDEVHLAEARAEQALAQAEIAAVVQDGCEIRAPFDGLVVRVEARPYEQPHDQLPLMTILDDRKIEVEMVVPSHWLNWLSPGSQFRFTIDETGQTVPGTVDRLSAEIDAVSQTMRIYGIVEKTGYVQMLSGMSGTAIFPRLGDG